MNQLQEIEIEVCRASGIETDKLFIKSRKREYVLARHICMYLAKRLGLKPSLEEIGKHYGGRDHTTAIHAIQNINDFIDTQDEKFMKIINCLSDRFKINFEIDPRLELMKTLSIPIIKINGLKMLS